MLLWPRRQQKVLAAAVLISVLIPCVASMGTTHPFWHSTYIGFGCPSNSYVPVYLDGVGVQAACELEPTAQLYSSEYLEVRAMSSFAIVD